MPVCSCKLYCSLKIVGQSIIDCFETVLPFGVGGSTSQEDIREALNIDQCNRLLKGLITSDVHFPGESISGRTLPPFPVLFTSDAKGGFVFFPAVDFLRAPKALSPCPRNLKVRKVLLPSGEELGLSRQGFALLSSLPPLGWPGRA